MKSVMTAAALFMACVCAHAEMRELTTDRPDKTEAPNTVDKGHFQFETDLVNFTHDKGEGVETKTWNFNLINLKAGVTDSADVQLIMGFVRQLEYRKGGQREVSNSFSDVTIRFKQNLVGNDEGKFAIALMPFIKVPTAREPVGNKKVEGGLIAPWSYELPAGFDFGSMLQLNAALNDDNDYQEETVLTFTLGHDIYGGLGAFVEVFGSLGTDYGSAVEATADVGFTFEFVKNWQLDAGMFFGITEAAPDYQPFLGLSAKI